MLLYNSKILPKRSHHVFYGSFLTFNYRVTAIFQAVFALVSGYIGSRRLLGPMFSLCPVILLVLLVTHLLSFDAEYSTQVCYSFFFSSRELKTTRNHSSGSPGHCHMAFSWSAFPLKSLLSMANILLFRCLPRLFSSMWPLTISCPASSPPLAFFSFSLGRTTGVKALLVRHCVVVLV